MKPGVQGHAGVPEPGEAGRPRHPRSDLPLPQVRLSRPRRVRSHRDLQGRVVDLVHLDTGLNSFCEKTDLIKNLFNKGFLLYH